MRGAGIDVVLDVRNASDLRAFTDLHVADDTGMRPCPRSRRARNARFRSRLRQLMPIRRCGDLNEIVDLRS